MLGRCTLFLSVALSLAAQTQPPQQPKPATSSTDSQIRVDVNEVIVPVTVTDEKGRFVSNLDQKDFKIFDSGKEQSIRFFTRERNQPVVVGFLMDASNASRIHWKTYQE